MEKLIFLIRWATAKVWVTIAPRAAANWYVAFLTRRINNCKPWEYNSYRVALRRAETYLDYLEGK